MRNACMTSWRYGMDTQIPLDLLDVTALITLEPLS